MKFEESPDAIPCTNPGVICLYARAADSFQKILDKCWSDGLVVRPSSAEEAAETGEFQIQSCIDPESGKQIIPLQLVIRSPLHPECPVCTIVPLASA